MRYLALPEVLEIHRRVLAQSGGALGCVNLEPWSRPLSSLR